MISKITPIYQQNINFQARYHKDNERLNKALRYSSATTSFLPAAAISSQAGELDSIPALYQLGDKIIELQKINGDGALADLGRVTISVGESTGLPALGSSFIFDDNIKIIKEKDDDKDKNILS